MQAELQSTMNKIQVTAFDLFDYLQEENPAIILAYRKDTATKAELLMDYIREMDFLVKKSE